MTVKRKQGLEDVLWTVVFGPANTTRAREQCKTQGGGSQNGDSQNGDSQGSPNGGSQSAESPSEGSSSEGAQREGSPSGVSQTEGDA
ncbi:hypothetical protein GCM10010344_60680 [Streptomyces bluensis]|nr:hypothetical protein GCM10010344_60680 [Streptomyces bluensis]